MGEGFSARLKEAAAATFNRSGRTALSALADLQKIDCVCLLRTAPQPADRSKALRTAGASSSMVKGFFTTISSANFPLSHVWST
jgi:hypothetical protein